jgi:diguanylate cyclase (GGDEF)-like protein
VSAKTNNSGPAPKKSAPQSSPVGRKRKTDLATTDVFARHATSRRDDPAPERRASGRKGDDAAPERRASVDSAPIGLRKASIPESGRNGGRGGDFAELPRAPAGTRETEAVKKRDDVDASRAHRSAQKSSHDSAPRRDASADARTSASRSNDRLQPRIPTSRKSDTFAIPAALAEALSASTQKKLDAAPRGSEPRIPTSRKSDTFAVPRMPAEARTQPTRQGTDARRKAHQSGPVAMSLPTRWRRAFRRAGKVSIGAAGAALACVVVAVGGVDGASLLGATVPLPQAMVSTAIAALVAIAVIRRAQFAEPSARAQRVSMWLAAAQDLADLELALALVAGLHVVIAVTGGLTSPGYPALYGLVAFAMTVLARPGALATIGAALFLEAALVVRTGITDVTVFEGGLHALFIGGAAAAHALLLRGLTSRYRQRRARRLDDELSALRDTARDYRLIAAALGPASRAPRQRDEEERLLAIGGVGMIGDSMSWVLATLKRSLAARTVALLWLEDSDGERVKLTEVASDADDITESPKLPNAGVLGAVIRDRQPLLVGATKPGQLPYYDSGRAGVALVAVPILEGTHLRGILAADRDAAFTEADRDLLANACAQVLRVVQGEQVFRAVERSKYEHERFYQATAMLGRALTPEQVMETAFDACAAIVDYDAAAIALYDKDHGKHRICAVRIGEGGEGVIDPNVLGVEFKDNAGLASMVIKNRHYLPSGGEPREVTAPIYTRKVKIDDAKSLIVMPLLSADEAIGTFTLVSRTEKKFGKDVREMLSVIANQVAISLQNGFLYKKMETMATTDGLTGLTNHRTFQSRFEDLIQRAQRHGHKVALLLCDVDHFKKVNDNYGHPVGDEVLRRVAKVLQEVPRKIDIPARYGGEEFAVILDNVDVEQAKAVANRIRIEIQNVVVDTEKGPLSVTESVGVCVYPEDGPDRATLIERADLALYHAKHNGRNQVVTWAEALAAKNRAAAG